MVAAWCACSIPYCRSRCCGCRCPPKAGTCICCTTPAPPPPPAARPHSPAVPRGWRWASGAVRAAAPTPGQARLQPPRTGNPAQAARSQELRTAQDGLLHTTDADSLSSLEHLPQGVVVIDRELRLVAWNSRYLELFRFPADLVRVGRPIEELFRFNARRGLLGPGPVDEAIERRLNHLRSGPAHAREREGRRHGAGDPWQSAA